MDMEVRPTQAQPVFDLASVMADVAEARGLPNSFYVDAGVHEVEKRALFFDTWGALDFASDAAEPGDAKPVDYLGMPLLMLRDRSGALRVFQNICRHRGMILVDKPRRVGGALRCPYHSWCYGLDGRLVSTPHVGGPGQNLHPGVRRSELGLVEVRCHVWRDVVFVNVSGNAPPFEEHAAALIGRWAEFERPDWRPANDSRFTLDVACNWKLAVENYCESYHLPWVHPGLNAYSRLEDHYHIIEEGRFSGQGTRVYKPRLGDGTLRFGNFTGLSSRWDAAAEYIALYPNVLFGVHRDHVYAILLCPMGPGRTLERMSIRYAREESLGSEFDALRRENEAQWKDIFREDIGVVEGMQKGRHASGFDGGKFSPVMDTPTHAFHRWAAGRMMT